MSNIKVTTDSGKFIAGARTDSGDHVGDVYLYHNGTNSFIENETGILYVTNKASASLILGTANTTAVTIDNSQNATFAGNVNITSSSNVYLSIDTTQSNGDEWQILNAVSGTTSGLQFKDIDTSKLVMLLQEDGNVGIGTSSPSNPLEVAVGAADESVKLSCYSTTDAHHGALLLTKSANATIGTAAATAAGETLGAIVAQGHRTGDNAVKAAASIKFQGDAAPDGDSVPGRIIFSTSDADDAGSPTERMRIDDAGNVGIGALIDDFTPTLGVTGAQPGLVLDDSATEAFFVAYCDGDVSVIMYDHSDSFIIKQAESIGGSGAADVLKLDSSKNATFSGKVIINQSTDNASISIDTASTGNHAILVDGPLTQTGCAGLLVNDCDALTTGSAIQVQCASTSLATTANSGLVMINHTGNSSSNANNLLYIKNDHASATGTTCLKIKQDSTAPAIVIEGSSSRGIEFYDGSEREGAIIFDESTDGFVFKVGGTGGSLTDAMHIDSSGGVGIGDSSPDAVLDVVSGTNGFVQILQNTHGSSPYGLAINHDHDADNNTRKFLNCDGGGTNRCIIWSDGDVNNSDNAYGSISDVRIKQGIRDANSQWDDIKAIKVRNFKKNEDVLKYKDKAWEQIGVIAQELEESGMDKLVREHPADESEIATNEDINEGDMVKSVQYSIIYMKAIKALQEAMAKIETLESKVTALENA